MIASIRSFYVCLVSTFLCLIAATASAQSTVYTLQGGGFNVPDIGGYPLLTNDSWELDQGSTVVASSNVNPSGWGFGHNGGDPSFFIVGMPTTIPAGTYAFKINSLSGSASDQITLVVGSSMVTDQGVPPSWAEDSVPSLEADSGGGGPSAYDRTEIASGVYVHEPPPDIAAYNAVGPSATFKRMYRTGLAAVAGYAQGMTVGWTNNYAFVIIPSSKTSWSNLTLVHPNGAGEVFAPILSGGTPTGAFTGPTGCPYTLVGQAGTSAGEWNSLTIEFNDLSAWTFLPSAGSGIHALFQKGQNLIGGGNASSYALAKMANGAGRYISIVSNSSYAISSIQDDSATPNTLLSFSYDGNGHLQSIQDVPGNRQVNYSFGSAAGTTCLLGVSQVFPVGGTSPGDRFDYSYTAVTTAQFTNAPFLTSVITPKPSGAAGTAANGIQYDQFGRASVATDASGNARSLTYAYGDTAVEAPGLAYNGNFNAILLSTGFTDAVGTSMIAYTDSVNPFRPTTITDKDGQSYTVTYDSHGNVATSTTLRNITTTYSYIYPSYAPNGLVSSVQTAGKASTIYTYYPTTGSGGIAGYLEEVQSPLPGTSNTGQHVESRLYTYTALGDVATVQVPNYLGTLVTYTFSYGTTEHLGQPAKLTDPLGNSTSYLYDSLGRLTQTTDASGNVTGYQYNEANQLTQITYPSISGNGHAEKIISYAGLGGNPYSVEDLAENGSVARVQTVSRGSEGEILGLAGNLIPAALGLDGSFRPTTYSDGLNVTTANYNGSQGLNELDSITHAQGDGVSAQNDFDRDGNPLESQNGRGQIATYTRASDDSRITQITYPSHTTSFSYDNYDRITQVQDTYSSSGLTYSTVSYTYDDLDNVLSRVYAYKAVNSSQQTVSVSGTVSYTYYPDNSRATMSTPSGIYTYLAYDNDGRLATLSIPWSSQNVTYTYTPTGAVKTQVGYVYTTHISYNSRNWPESMYSEGNVSNFLYATIFNSINYNALGGITSYSPLLESIGYALDCSANVSLSFDSFNRMSSLTHAFTQQTGVTYTRSVTRDSAGLVTSRTDSDNGSFLYTPDSDEHITTNADTFDLDGNPTMFNSSEVGFQNAGMTYDEENRLTSIAGVLTNTWSGIGQRAYKSDASGNLTFFIYDGGMVVDELTSTGSVHASYAYGPYGLIERYDVNVGGGVGFAFDPFGSPTQRWYESSIASGSYPLDLEVFDAGGEIISDTSVESGFQLTQWDPVGAFGQWGAFTDEQTRAVGKSGWLFSGERFYDVASGRYLTRDERFPSPYTDGDDGSAVINTFQVLGMVPVIGAPFNVAMGAYDVSEGSVGSGALQIAAGFLDVAPEIPMAGALGAISRAEKPAGTMARLATEGEEFAAVAKSPLGGFATDAEDLKGFESAGDFRIQSYKELRKATKGTKFHAHHLIERRFAGNLKVNRNDMLSMALTPDEHLKFTNMWRGRIPYGTTSKASRDMIESAARFIYGNYPSILKALDLVK